MAGVVGILVLIAFPSQILSNEPTVCDLFIQGHDEAKGAECLKAIGKGLKKVLSTCIKTKGTECSRFKPSCEAIAKTLNDAGDTLLSRTKQEGTAIAADCDKLLAARNALGTKNFCNLSRQLPSKAETKADPITKGFPYQRPMHTGKLSY